jgi:glucose/arabinose dehydrogenase
MFPEFKNNIFITLHGSWNRSKKVGYKVIRVILDDSGEVLEIKDFISGWLKNDKISGRPSAPFMMQDGSLLISDDKANLIYRVTSN